MIFSWHLNGVLTMRMLWTLFNCMQFYPWHTNLQCCYDILYYVVRHMTLWQTLWFLCDGQYFGMFADFFGNKIYKQFIHGRLFLWECYVILCNNMKYGNVLVYHAIIISWHVASYTGLFLLKNTMTCWMTF